MLNINKMEDSNNHKPKKRTKSFIIIMIFVLLFSLFYLALQSAFITEFLKKAILKEVELASKQKVSIRKIKVNPFPLFIEAKDVSIINEVNKQIISIKRIKGYVSNPQSIFNKKIYINRLVIYEPIIHTNKEEIEKIVSNINEYIKKQREDVLKVKFKVIETIKCNADISIQDTYLKFTDLNTEFITGEKNKLRLNIKNINIKDVNLPDLNFNIDTDLSLNKNIIEVKRLKLASLGSTIQAEGYYSNNKGSLKTSISIIFDTMKRIFNLKENGNGEIKAKGEIRFDDKTKSPFSKDGWKNLFIDLKLNGNFYLETLMELLKVKEKLNGFVSFQGILNGSINNIRGNANTKLKNGNLFGVDVDYLKCNVSYQNGRMLFSDAEAKVYNGFAKAEASITLPVVNFYTLNIKFQSADNKPILKLIGWEPDIPQGKVDGELSTSGSYFNPDGWFKYKPLKNPLRVPLIKNVSDENKKNVLNRIKDITGKFRIRDGILTLWDLHTSTSDSRLIISGEIDLNKKLMNLKSSLISNNVYDLLYPFYSKLKGNIIFSGDIKGKYENPLISGSADFKNIDIDGYSFDKASAVFSYNKNLLNIEKLSVRAMGEEHTAHGNIYFLHAKELFDISSPEYDLKLSLINARFKNIADILKIDIKTSGTLNANLNLKGKGSIPDISGNLKIDNVLIYKIPLDSISTPIEFKNRELTLSSLKLVKGNSIFTGNGSFFIDNKKFNYLLNGKNINLKDFNLKLIDTSMDISSEGRGTIENPSIKLYATSNNTNNKNYNIGHSTISAKIENKTLDFYADILDKNVTINGKANLDERFSWSAEATLKKGRYNLLITSLLKEVPEDLQLNLEGKISMNGDKNNIKSFANLEHLTLNIYGQTFNNVNNIQLFLQNRNLTIKPFNLKSGLTSFKLEGEVEIGKQYDILINGSSSLSPLKGLSNKIGYLKGDTDFVVSITGKWDKPKVDGGMSVTNASFGLKDYPYYLSSINGYIYMDEDKIIIQKISGKFSGGDVKLSGSANLKAFNIEKFYLDIGLNNISLPLGKDINLNIGGSLIYKGDKNKQQITGDVKINRAKFRQMVEWRTWLVTKKQLEITKKESSPFEKAELNIRISGSENIFIDNNIARAPVNIRGDMIVKGTPSNPVLFGRLESTEGYVYFKNNEFRIIYASADFIDPNIIKPIIHLNAETLVKGYNIKLNLEGQLDHFNLALSSDPYLDEVDILSLLTVGQIGKQLKGLAGGIGAGEATAFITGKVQDVIEERLRTITGLDRFQVEPSVSTVTGTISPKITVSKRFISDKLFVTYSNLIGSTEEQVIKVEYQIDKNIYLIGVRDERGSMGGDIKFRFEFK